MSANITWLGHSCFQIEIAGKSILVDPFITDSPVAPCRADSLSPDIVLITHGHFDHIADAVSIAKRSHAVCVSNFEICEWLGKQGVKRTEPMNLGGGISLDGGITTKSTLAHHSSTLPDGTPGGNPGGFLISADGKQIYIAGDTALFSDMRLYAGAIDLAIVPIGDRYTMGPSDAVEAIKLLAPRQALPCHYNTWPPIAQDANAWAAQVRQLTSCTAHVLNPGDSLTL
jgi:L-ascorbate metabolism protein UlaG (beta-lactamase superfamily)